MAKITIREVETKKELKKFIRFNYELYKDNPYSFIYLYKNGYNYQYTGSKKYNGKNISEIFYKGYPRHFDGAVPELREEISK